MIHKQRLNNRILSLVLALVMVLSMLPMTSLTAFAADEHTHDWGETKYEWGTLHDTCTATRVCKTDSTHVETAQATIYVVEHTDPILCVLTPSRTYCAYFGEEWAKYTEYVLYLKNADNHVSESYYADNGDGTHSKYCDGCDKVLAANDMHEITSGKCWMCGYVDSDATVSVEILFNGGVVSEDVKESWIQKGYTVEDDRVIVTTQYDSLVRLSFISDLTKEGYVISGLMNRNGTGTVYPVNTAFEINGTLSLAVQWEVGEADEANTHLLTIDCNGGKWGPNQTSASFDVLAGKQYVIGEVCQIVIQGARRQGYTLVGFNTAADGTGTAYTSADSITVTGDLTLYLQWKADETVTLTFDFNGGKTALNRISAGINVSNGTQYVIGDVYSEVTSSSMNNPIRQGYTLVGFNTAADGTGTAYTSADSITITGNLTLYLQWKANGTGTNSCIVSFNANGGTGRMNSVVVQSGKNYILPECTFIAPADHAFKAWSVGGEEKAVGDSITVTAHTTVTAVWERTAQSITISAVAGTKITISGNQYHYIWTATEEKNTGTFNNLKFGQTYTVTVTVPTGYEAFESTTLSVGLDGTITFGGATLDDDGVYQLNLTKIDYTITFNSNDGSAVPSQTVTYNDKVAKPADPTREGFIFAGWFSDMGLSSRYDFDTSVTGNLTLYAGWYIKYYTVTFDSNGGSEVSSQEVAYRYTAYDPSDPTLEGFTFAGWFTDEALTTEYSFNTPVTKDTTLYAKWEPQELTGTVTITGDMQIGSTLTAAVTDTNNTGTLSYQWYRYVENNTAIEGATDSTYTLTADDITYHIFCVVSSSIQTATIDGYASGTVTKKEIGISWGNTSFTYNGSAQMPTATATGTLNNDSIVLTVTVNKESVNAGEYTATVTGITGENAGSYRLPSDVTITFTIKKADQNKPAVGKTDETISNKKDGKITDVNSTMEYRKDGKTTYTDITGNTVENLAAGKYYVRVKGDDNHNPSDETEVIIAEGGKLAVTVPQNQIGYTLTANNTKLEWHGSTTLVFELADGYSKTAEFSVSATGATLTDNGDGTYTISNAEDNVIITVRGVADTTTPEAEMSISTNKWTNFLNNITFGMFFKETQDITITATDAGSGLDKIYYLISETVLDEDSVEALANIFWTEYDAANKPSISPDRECIVYVKVIDKAQNVKYISSDGLVFDGTAPVISGIENGKTYYGQVVFGVTDGLAGIVSVEIDGVDKTHFEGQYVINPDNKEHTVVATDKAGNKTEYKITVYKNYTVTYKIDGETVSTQTVGHGADATAPAIPEKEGYTQTAPVWDKDGKNITADTEINAVYTINEYTITFMDEKGVYKTVTVKHGEKVTMPEVPTKDGYTVKWEATIDKATGDTTVKAVYTEIPATDKPSSPQTGDNSNMALWFVLLFISGGAVITLTVYDRKRRTVNR